MSDFLEPLAVVLECLVHFFVVFGYVNILLLVQDFGSRLDDLNIIFQLIGQLLVVLVKDVHILLNLLVVLLKEIKLCNGTLIYLSDRKLTHFFVEDFQLTTNLFCVIFKL